MRVGFASRLWKGSRTAPLATISRAVGFALVCSCSTVSSAAEPESNARQFIESLGIAARSIILSHSLNSDRKLATMRALLQKSVDLKTTGRRVLAHSWRAASEAQREEYDDLFANYVLRIYRRALQRHRSQKFVVTEAKGTVGQETLVFSRIEGPKSRFIHWAWRVREEGGEYRITDLQADGISLTSTLRDEFKSYVFHHGLGGLLEKLRSIE